MDFINRLFKNKNFQNLFFGIIFFVLIINFPFLLLLITPVIIIAVVFFDNAKQSKIKNERNGKLNNPELQEIVDDLQSNDLSKIKEVTERLPSILEDIETPKTFHELVGDVGIKADIYYAEGLYDLTKSKDNENAFIIDELQKVMRVCDEFFDGKEYMKCWSIFRKLEQGGVTEDEFNNVFPDLVPILKKIRERNWEDIAWSWFIADQSEKIYGKDNCTKEIFLKTKEKYSIKYKEDFLETLPEENKKDYQLLIELDLNQEKKKNRKNYENLLKSFDAKKFGNKPKRIRSTFNWDLEDTIKFAKKIQSNYSELLKSNRYNNIDESRRKELQYAGLLRSKDFYETIFDEKIAGQIQDIERVSDFYQYEMFDEDPIQTAIDNEDIERMMFYSLIQIPKKTISQIEKVSTDDPLKRAPYFAIMFDHMKILLLILEELGIFNSKEIVIRSWVIDQITDPLDKGKSSITFRKDNKKGTEYDQRFLKELWLPLYRFLEIELCNPKGLVGEVEDVIQVIESIAISALYNYYVGDPEEGYELMKPISDATQEVDDAES